MDDWILLGIVAGLLTTIGFVPQIIKSLRTRRMEEVSLMMPLLLCAGMSLWFLYGVMKADAAIMLWNAVGLTMNMTLVGLKLHYQGRKRSDPNPVEHRDRDNLFDES